MALSCISMLMSVFFKSQKAFLLALEPLRQISADHNNNDGDQLRKHSFLIPPVDEIKSGVKVNNNNNNNDDNNNNNANNNNNNDDDNNNNNNNNDNNNNHHQLFVERVTT